MRTINAKTEKCSLKCEIYENPAEVLNIVGNREHVFDKKDFFSDKATGGYWYGFDSGKQLKADFLIAKADPSAIQQVKSAFKVRQTADKKRVKFVNDVCGFQPVVPLALMGVPEAMITSRIVPIKSKVLDVYIDTATSCQYSADQVAEAGKKVIEEVLGLELAGYRVNLTAVDGFCMDTHRGCEVASFGVKIKSAGQPLDVSRCIYPFVNPAFSRGISFGWYQRTDGFIHFSYYGQPLSSEPKTVQDFVQRQIAGKTGIYLRINDVLKTGNASLLSEYVNKSA